jgi:tetratricopeptide (TPR) repeat protein
MRRTGRCLSYGRGITYWPVAEILREHFGMLENEPPETALARLAGRRILGLVFGIDVAPELHPLVAREQLHEATAGFLEEVCSARPLVLLVEDLHWAEEDLLDLVDRLLADVHGPLLVISTARPEVLDKRPAWGGGKRNVTILGLDPLSDSQTEEMVAQLLAADLPEPVRAALVERAGGNPFFIEELVATFIDHGVLERSNGGWTARSLPEGFEIPDSVQAVLAARIDLLPPAEKAALQAAAVIGRTFWAGAVAELLGGEEPDYALLEDRDFIRRRSNASFRGEREFVIKHALTREVAYASLPKARRAKLHAAFAGWIERSVDASDEQAALLGHHYAEAVRPADADLAWEGEVAELSRLRQKAVDWLERAGRLATGRYELDDAVVLFRRALELEDDRGRLATLWYALGKAYAYKYDGKGFSEAMQQAIECCDDDALRADLYTDLSLDTALRAGMFTTLPAVEVVDGWVEQALSLAEPGSPNVAKAWLAAAHWRRSRGLSDGVAEAERAIQLTEEFDDPDLRALGREERALAAFAAGDLEEAATWAERGYELHDVKDPDLVADVHAVAAVPAAALGQFERARSFARRHEEAVSTLTPHHRLHGVAISVEVEELAGDWAAVGRLEGLVRERVTANLTTPCMRNARSVLLCTIAAELEGDRERAAELEDWARKLQSEGFERAFLAPELRLALVRGDVERAERILGGVRGATGPTWFGLSGTLARFDARLSRSAGVTRWRSWPPA